MLVKIILITLLLVMVGCTQDLRIMWDPLPEYDEQGVSHYVIFKWEGDSIAQYTWTVDQMDSIGTLPHVQNYSGPYEFRTFFAEDKWIRGGAIAVDSLSRVSAMGLTKFYGFPGNLEEIWIEKVE
jgi:hypothetical protein